MNFSKCLFQNLQYKQRCIFIEELQCKLLSQHNWSRNECMLNVDFLWINVADLPTTYNHAWRIICTYIKQGFLKAYTELSRHVGSSRQLVTWTRHVGLSRSAVQYLFTRINAMHSLSLSLSVTATHWGCSLQKCTHWEFSLQKFT